MAANSKCILCSRECETRLDIDHNATCYRCISCGDFAATSEAGMDYLSRISQDEKQRIAACTRERNIRGLPRICLCSSEKAQDPPSGAFTVEYVLSTMFPSRIQDRFDRALGNLCRLTSCPGKAVRLQEHDKLPVTFSESQETASFVLGEMENMQFIRLRPSGKGMSGPDRTLTVTAAGIARMQQLEESEGRELSTQAFVAMWFDKELDEVFDKGITPGIRDCGFNPLRIDAKQTNKKVCDEIIAEIRRSRFLVADFTGARAGVYFEAGFAMGLGIPVICTCRNNKEHIDALHFDTRQYSHVLWNDSEDMYRKLANRIAATIPGAKRAPREG